MLLGLVTVLVRVYTNRCGTKPEWAGFIAVLSMAACLASWLFADGPLYSKVKVRMYLRRYPGAQVFRFCRPEPRAIKGVYGCGSFAPQGCSACSFYFFGEGAITRSGARWSLDWEPVSMNIQSFKHILLSHTSPCGDWPPLQKPGTLCVRTYFSWVRDANPPRVWDLVRTPLYRTPVPFGR